jgi:hypothetical protein
MLFTVLPQAGMNIVADGYFFAQTERRPQYLLDLLVQIFLQKRITFIPQYIGKSHDGGRADADCLCQLGNGYKNCLLKVRQKVSGKPSVAACSPYPISA